MKRRSARIIPAYAGSTYSHECELPDRQDHPRIRGEHDIRFATLAGNYGSSPHTRGAQLSMANTGLGVGIIPAYAGSTLFWVA